MSQMCNALNTRNSVLGAVPANTEAGSSRCSQQPSTSARRGRVFCTYIIGENQLEKLTNMERYVSWYIGQDESGAHGQKHIQLMFGYKNARTVSAVMKELNDGNIELVNDTEAYLKYCTNEEKRDGELHTYGSIPSFNKKVNKGIIDEALATGNYEMAMNLIENTDKLYFIQNQKKLCLYFTQKFDSHDKSMYKAFDFNRRLETDFKKCIVLIGATGLGKTQYALTHFNKPLHVRDREDWRRYTADIDGIVLDDLDFPAWSPLTFLKLLDIENPITQSIKYGSIRIKPNTARIICVNHEDLLWPRNIHEETKNACLRRMKIIHIRGPLFSVKRALSPEVIAGPSKKPDLKLDQNTPTSPTDDKENSEPDKPIQVDMPPLDYDDMLRSFGNDYLSGRQGCNLDNILNELWRDDN